MKDARSTSILSIIILLFHLFAYLLHRYHILLRYNPYPSRLYNIFFHLLNLNKHHNSRRQCTPSNAFSQATITLKPPLNKYPQNSITKFLSPLSTTNPSQNQPPEPLFLQKFFRRGLNEHKSYVCKYDKDCLINPQTRNACRFCRYNRCKRLGMSREGGWKRVSLGSLSKGGLGLDR